MRIITLSNNKGGSGKTTSTVCLAGAFAEAGHRVLVVDLDPQGTATRWFGGTQSPIGLVEFSEGGIRVSQLIQATRTSPIDLIPASSSLVPSGESRANDTGMALVRAFARLPDYWDLVLVDTPPTVGHLSLAPLVASDHVVVPVEVHALALPGVATVLTSVQRARQQVNRRLDLLGILACRVNATLHASEMLAELRGTYGSAVLRQTVRETIRLAEAPRQHLPITQYAAFSHAANDYRAVAAELLERMGGVDPLP